MASQQTAARRQNQSNKLDVIFPNTIKEYCTFDPDIHKRMLKYIKLKGMHKTQDLTRLAVSYFLDKEGF